MFTGSQDHTRPSHDQGTLERREEIRSLHEENMEKKHLSFLLEEGIRGYISKHAQKGGWAGGAEPGKVNRAKQERWGWG